MFRTKMNLNSLEKFCKFYSSLKGREEKLSFKYLTSANDLYDLNNSEFQRANEALSMPRLEVREKNGHVRVASYEEFFCPQPHQLRWSNMMKGWRHLFGQTREQISHNCATNLVIYRAIKANYLIPIAPGSHIYKLNRQAAVLGADTFTGRNITSLSDIEKEADGVKAQIMSGESIAKYQPKLKSYLVRKRWEGALGAPKDQDVRVPFTPIVIASLGVAAIGAGITVGVRSIMGTSDTIPAVAPGALPNPGGSTPAAIPSSGYKEEPLPPPGASAAVPGASTVVVTPPPAATRPRTIAIPGSVDEALQLIEHELQTNSAQSNWQLPADLSAKLTTAINNGGGEARLSPSNLARLNRARVGEALQIMENDIRDNSAKPGWYVPDNINTKLKDAINKAGGENALPADQLQRVNKLHADGHYVQATNKNPILEQAIAENRSDWRMRTSVKGGNKQNLVADLASQKTDDTPKWAKYEPTGETPKWAPTTKMAKKHAPDQTKPETIAKAQIDGQTQVREV